MILLISACGGDGAHGINGTGTAAGASAAPPPASPLPAASTVAQHCAAPRATDQAGSLDSEMSWIRSFSNETYLWYAELPTVDPAPYRLGATVPYVNPANNAPRSVTLNTNYQLVDAYFNSQRTAALTASGKPKDRFHFTYSTSVWQALSRTGTSAGFGFQVALVTSAPPRKVIVSLVEPGSTAAANGIVRGSEILGVNGVDVVTGADVATLNEGLFSPQTGMSYTFLLRDVAGGPTRNVSMTASAITVVAVPDAKTLPPPNERVGYIAFHDHIATAEIELLLAVAHLKDANQGSGIDDLVLDMRYNGGGFLDIAAELAFMIAGETATTGKFFEQLSYNDKRPVGLNLANSTTPFHNKTLGFFGAVGQALPQLSLHRVYVLTGSATCSASEALLNGLRGVGVEVIQIGATTCGKPYGFVPQDNCGTTYFTIQFKGVNALGYGDYVDGFSPGGQSGTPDSLPGCVVADDFSHALGDPQEHLLSAALQFRSDRTCPPLLAKAQAAQAPGDNAGGLALSRPPWRDNRIYRQLN